MLIPRLYQLEGAKFLASCPDGEGRLLCDEPGLGKTLQAIVACKMVAARQVLVVCPSIARVHWERELREVYGQAPRILRIEATADINGAAAAAADLVVVSWALLVNTRVYKALRRIRWDVVILDEAHAAKNPESQRTRATYGDDCTRLKGGVAGAAKRVFALTATPISSGPHEFWPHYRALFPHATKRVLDYDNWIEATCQTIPSSYGPRITGVKKDAADRLRRRLAPFILRRKKIDVAPELPRLEAVETPIDLPVAEREDIERQMREMGITPSEMGLEERTISAAIEAGAELPGDVSSISTLMRLLGQAKAQPAAELIHSALQGGIQKVVAFARHTEVLRTMEAALGRYGYRPVVVEGRTSPTLRQTYIDGFQKHPAYRVFLGQIDACSTAITLTASSDVFVVEPSWATTVNMQAIQRCHRIGQTKPVLARFLSAAGTVDELVQRALARKARTLELLGFQER